MLKRSDFDAFVDLVRLAAKSGTKAAPIINADKVLRAKTSSTELLHRNELSKLRCSLKIAFVADDVPESAHRILYTIVQDLSHDGFSYLPLTCSRQWLDAIAWAVANPATPMSEYLPNQGKDRQWAVGRACQALRRRGYPVEVGVLGPEIDAETRTRIAKEADSVFAQMGGIDAAELLFQVLRGAGKLHSSMWLLGNIPAGIDQPPQPAMPFGWLLSIALRNIHVRPSTTYPARDWVAAIEIATNFAASTDCQRYNRFDGFSLNAPDFLPTLMESLAWRELFTLPQVPPLVLSTLQNAFSQIQWPQGTDDLRRDVDGLFLELNRLLANLRGEGLTLMPERDARFEYPLLWMHARAPESGVNAGYLDPFGAHPRDHDRYVFFQAYDGQVAVLPPSLAAAAGCEAVFRFIWDSADQDVASDIVGDSIESAVAVACRAHTALVWQKVRYRADGADLEIDVAARENNEIVLFEAKAKSLTSQARTGDLIACIDDYTKSFLALLGQLVRHDLNIKAGATPLTQDDDPNALRILKVAVSPLSYGPMSDHVLANALMHSIAQARLDSVDGDPRHARVLDAFNQSVQRAMDIIDQVAPRKDGKVDMGRYLMQVSWFDLGQLLYALNRGRALTKAISALRHLTYSTRDFWTEAARADRQGLSDRNWHPSSEGEAAD